MAEKITDRSDLARFAWLSVAAAVLTIALKTIAYFLTGSVGLLSDALESTVNLVGALMALVVLVIAARPADEEHTFGHSKAEYFSSGVEGALIIVAAISIAYTAIERLLNPRPLDQVGLGLAVSVCASLINLGVSLTLQKAGKEYNSVSLSSNASHLMTDVWTSAGVLVGVGAVAVTRWQPLDSLVAIGVAVNIISTGVGIIRTAVSGLMDTSLDGNDLDGIRVILDSFKVDGIEYHNLRTRQSGAAKFISVHVLVPGEWTVARGHKLVTNIEAELVGKINNSQVLTHLEAKEDPASMDEVDFINNKRPSNAAHV